MKQPKEQKEYLDSMRLYYIREQQALRTMLNSEVGQPFKEVVEKIDTLWKLEKYFINVYETIYWFNRG